MGFANRKHTAGFVLLEALVAVLIVALGIMALAKLEAMVISSGGESRARSEAVALARAKTDELRNAIIKSQFVANGTYTSSATVTGQANTYTLHWDVTTPDANLEQRLITAYVTWTNAAGNTQRVDLNTLVAWDDSITQVRLTTSTGTNLITPTGSAKRGDGNYTGRGVTTPTDNGITKLVDTGTGKTILYLDPGSNGAAQQFTTISGRVYFDQNQISKIPHSTNVRVRLSSEGECIYDNGNGALVTAGSDYKYFTYVCYVGPGWYGNIAVTIDPEVNGNASNPTICLGDPGFNNGVSNSTSTSAHSDVSATRSYRGFYHDTVGQTYLTRGVLGGTAYPKSGSPLPSSFPSFYPSVTAGSANDYFDHNFLITTKGGTCQSKMQLGGSPGTEFSRNAGKYYCLSPDDDTAHADSCPSVWPGYESEVGSGGSINWLLTVANSGSGSGTVVSTPAGINCGSSCSASFASGTSVTLNPTAGANSVFAGWSGDCTGTASCIVDMSAARNVTATFNPAASTQYNLAVVMAGTGTGTVTSAPTGITCGSVCNANFAANATVALTATASSGTFTGWSGGGCTGTGACTVTMDAAKTVTANFQSAAPTTYTLTVAKSGSGSGTVSSSPSGINCGTTCSASFNTGTSVTLTAAASTNNVFAGWSGACTGSGTTCTLTMSQAQNVTALFTPSSCSTPISGTAHDKQGQVAVTSPSGAGSCSMNSSSSNGYSCSLTTAPGTQVTLTNSRTGGQAYSYSLSVTANCTVQTDVNFP